MTKFYILSTHKLDAGLEERVFGFDATYRREIPDNEWIRWFQFLDGFYGREWHHYYELPVRENSHIRVIAIHDLPEGNDAVCSKWIEALCGYFSDNDNDDVTFILHDKDLQAIGDSHFFHDTRQLGTKSIRVYGFHHGDDDVIGRRICSAYRVSDDFSLVMDPVLNVVRLKTILDRCSAEARFPNRKEYDFIESQITPESMNWEETFRDSSSCEYLDYLDGLCDGLLRPFLL